jgi:hypothetical protein
MLRHYHLQRARGLTNHNSPSCYIVRDRSVGANRGAIVNGNVSDQGGSSANRHLVAYGWVTLHRFQCLTAKGDAVIDVNVIADYGRFTDYDAHAVVYEKTTANGCTRVNFYAGPQASHV